MGVVNRRSGAVEVRVPRLDRSGRKFHVFTQYEIGTETANLQ